MDVSKEPALLTKSIKSLKILYMELAQSKPQSRFRWSENGLNR